MTQTIFLAILNNYGVIFAVLSARVEEGGLEVDVFGDGDVAALAEAAYEEVVEPVALHVLGSAAAEGVRLAAELHVGVKERVFCGAATRFEVFEEGQGAGVALALHEGTGVGELEVVALLLGVTLFEEAGYSLVLLKVFTETPVAVGAEGCEGKKDDSHIENYFGE